MKKNTQVVLAGAVVLGLAAGGGTFALWNSEASLDGGGVTTGKLAVAAGTVSYADASTDLGENADRSWDNATDRMVPGDTVVSSQDLDVTLVGKNLSADLKLVSGSDASAALIDPALIQDPAAPKFTVQFAVVAKGTVPAAGDWKDSAQSVTLRSGLTPASADTAQYTVHVRYNFDKSAGNLDAATTAAQADKAAKLIEGTKVQLTQVR